MAAVADGVRVGIDFDHEPRLASGMVEIDRDENAQQVADFVGQVFEQFRGIRQTDDFPLVVASDFQAPAFGIGESGNPAEKVVAPRLLPFGVLGFDAGHWWGRC